MRPCRLGLLLPVVTALLLWLAWLPRAAMALDYIGYDLAAEQGTPRVCFTFSDRLARRSADALRSFVVTEPAVDAALTLRQKDLCLTGLAHGRSYGIRLRAGLAGEDGSRLGQDVTLDLRVPDRAPRVSFRSGYVLPRGGDAALPLLSVNVERADIALYRIGERNLLAQITDGLFGEELNRWSRDRIADESGQKLFEGEVRIEAEPNREATTTLALAEMAGPLAPGLYILTARPHGDVGEDWEQQATQWFTVSDLALATFQGEDGLTILVRSLQTAAPMADVGLELLARNNEPLARIVSDADGRAHLPAGLLRGEGGNAPRVLLAIGPAGDFTFLDLQGGALDLVDRDVDGRSQPGPLDAMVATERGIYRPGESVHVTVLLRDQLAMAVPDLPLTLQILRPDMIEAERIELGTTRLGGGTALIPIASSAYTGQWTVNTLVGATGRPIGSTTFLVEDFVPPRIELALEPDRTLLHAGEALGVSLDARYLYGAPAADLGGELELLIQQAAEPFADFPGYGFGLVQEPFLAQRIEPVAIRTDAEGKAGRSLPVEIAGDTMAPLEVEMRGRVFDLDGRPVQAVRSVPFRPQAAYVGIRPAFAGSLPADGEGRFDLVLLDAAGAPIAGRRLAWELVQETYDYVWFERYGQWDYETTILDNRLDAGEIAVDAAGRASLAVPVGSGAFRLEVYDPASNAASSRRFHAGWWASPADERERPDDVTLRIETATATSGKVRAFVAPPFPARVVLALADAGIRAVTEVEAGPEGRFVDLEGWQPRPGGSYLLATAYAAAGVVRPRLPARAVGVAWIAGEQAERRLDVRIEAAAETLPETRLPVAVQVSGLAAGEPAFVTLAAVDDGILKLTDFQTPDPAGWYLGKRSLGIELRDLYGRLIDPEGRRGRIVSGGDARARLQLGGLDVRSSRTVALFAGPLAVDAAGRAEVALDLPDFNGRLRLMAIAWSRERVGGGEAQALVRTPVIADLTLPRFLAPGDQASLVLALTNLAAPVGSYRVQLHAEGAVTLEPQLLTFEALTPGKPASLPVRLGAGELPGRATIRLEVAGPDGIELERRLEIAVRPARAYETRRQVALLDPGRQLTIDGALAADMVPGSGVATMLVTARPSLDVAGLLREVEAYPYGCGEQLASKGLPLALSPMLEPDLAPDEAARRAAMVSEVLRRLASLQGARGGFALWSPLAADELWLTAYVTDFLLTARNGKVPVAEAMVGRALDRLAGGWVRQAESPADIAATAYAAYVLGRAGRLDLSDLRYIADRHADRLPSPLARVQLASALADRGDRAAAAGLLAGVAGAGRDPALGYADYGSALRDAAAVVALIAEGGLLPPAELLPLATDLAGRLAATRWTSTQERAWAVRAVAALQRRGGEMRVAIDGVPLPADVQSVERRLTLAPGAPPLAIRNQGVQPVYRALTLTGIPLSPATAVSEGYRLRRTLHRPDGTAVDPATLRQNDQVMVLIEGAVEVAGAHRSLLVDLLPAGLELENLRFAGTPQLDEYRWLGELSQPLHVELRDDRYVAALDLDDGQRSFRLAYLARAVTRGAFTLPGTRIEDMYQPHLHAGLAAGSLEIAAR